MAEKRSVFSEPRFWLLITIGLFVVALAIWYVWPLRHLSPTDYRPDGASILVYTAIDRNAPGTQQIINEAKTRLLGVDPSSTRRFLFNAALRIGLPKRISAWLVPGASRDELTYAAIVDFGRGGRLVRTFARRAIQNRLFDDWSSGQVDRVRVAVDWAPSNGIGPGALAFHKDSLIVAADLDTLSDALGGASPREGRFAQDVNRTLETVGGFHIVGENESGALGALIAAVEEEFAFSIMPSADSLVAMNVTASLEAGTAAGNALFLYDNPTRVDTGYADLRYAYGVIRRLLRPRGLDVDADFTVNDLTIQLDFAIEEFLTLLDSPEGDT